MVGGDVKGALGGARAGQRPHANRSNADVAALQMGLI